MQIEGKIKINESMETKPSLIDLGFDCNELSQLGWSNLYSLFLLLGKGRAYIWNNEYDWKQFDPLW